MEYDLERFGRCQMLLATKFDWSFPSGKANKKKAASTSPDEPIHVLVIFVIDDGYYLSGSFIVQSAIRRTRLMQIPQSITGIALGFELC